MLNISFRTSFKGRGAGAKRKPLHVSASMNCPGLALDSCQTQQQKGKWEIADYAVTQVWITWEQTVPLRRNHSFVFPATSYEMQRLLLIIKSLITFHLPHETISWWKKAIAGWRSKAVDGFSPLLSSALTPLFGKIISRWPESAWRKRSKWKSDKCGS